MVKNMTLIKDNKAEIRDASYYRNKIGIKKKDPKKLKELFDSLNKDLEEMAKKAGMTDG